MNTVIAYVSRPPEVCWRVLADATTFTGWVPGLRRARVIASHPDGLPAEIQFEYSSSLTYSLIYTYDVAALEMRWEPRLGKRDGVRGFARVEAFGDGCRLTYGFEPGDGRSPADLALGALDKLVAGFVRWMHEER
jgi:hypothetical protein